ncbi:P-loop NTPase fold protein [Paenibacillus phytohabitans]|uniref:P-loop NTPase fold protein n=1 Tax=Paenibacillus phytohabitans TaxID=2654978 RepID=UPI00300B2589
MFRSRITNMNNPQKKLFLEDKPLQATKDDKFQYNQVAEILYDLLNQNNFPTHIGLFAPWGSGKTSVIKLLEEIIMADKNNGDKYIIKTISVWKFSDDAPSLHRKIVREVQAELDVLDDEGLNNESTNIDIVTGIGIYSLLLANKKFKWATIMYFLLLISSFALSVFIKTDFFTSLMTSFISVSTLGLIMGSLKIFAGSFQRGKQSIVKQLPLIHGDQYEAKFKLSVEKFLKRNDGKNLILVFDDLDRLPPNQLLAALNTMKTFLHSKSCAFIIPCDEIVLRNGIKTAFEKKDILEENTPSQIEENYVSEYINKTFDHQIRLPILEQKNMKRYAKQLLLDQNISWVKNDEINLDKILGVLVHTSIKTPRQVKTLMNSFSSNWSLAKKRDNESGRKILSSNPLAIAVFTVLQTDYPEYYTELIADPFRITREDPKRTAEVSAYLSRVDKCIPKEDPRPFIYFSNEKLNPATGKPQVIEAQNFLLNAQTEPFKESYNALGDLEKEILLSSVISNFDDNPGLEVENCIETLIESEVDLSVVSQMELHSWDILLRDNLNVLTQYPPSKVCELLESLSYDDHTWMEYGGKIEVSGYYSDLLNMWIDNPNRIQKLNIPNLSADLEEAFIDNNHEDRLLSAIFRISSEHNIVTNINWINIMHKTLEKENELDFTLASWLQEWNLKTKNTITSSMITEMLKIHDFKTESFLEGIGQVWCRNFKQNNSELEEFIELLFHESFSGFNETDIKEINLFLKAADPYSEIRDVVNELLNDKWAKEKFEMISNYLSSFPDCPGTAGFCLNNFSFEIDEDMRELFLDVLVNRDYQFPNGITKLIASIKVELSNAASMQVESKAEAAILKLMKSEVFKKDILKERDNIIPINDKYIWLSWHTPVVTERLNLFLLLWNNDETATEWIFDCIVEFAKVDRNYVSVNYSYSSYARNYIGLFVEKLVSAYPDIEWEERVESWQGVYGGNIDLYSLLDVDVRSKVIGVLGRRCSIGFEAYNQLLNKYYDSSVSVHREVLFSRWETIGAERRKIRLQEIDQLSGIEQSESFNLLLTQLQENPLVLYWEEFVEWDIKDSTRVDLINALINSLSPENITDWIMDSMVKMNQDGFSRWRSFSIETAIFHGKVEHINDSDVLETALSLGRDRAKLALQLLRASKTEKSKIKILRNKIINLHNEFPELVESFGFRFKK